MSLLCSKAFTLEVTPGDDLPPSQAEGGMVFLQACPGGGTVIHNLAGTSRPVCNRGLTPKGLKVHVFGSVTPNFSSPQACVPCDPNLPQTPSVGTLSASNSLAYQITSFTGAVLSSGVISVSLSGNFDFTTFNPIYVIPARTSVLLALTMSSAVGLSALPLNKGCPVPILVTRATAFSFNEVLT